MIITAARRVTTTTSTRTTTCHHHGLCHDRKDKDEDYIDPNEARCWDHCHVVATVNVAVLCKDNNNPLVRCSIVCDDDNVGDSDTTSTPAAPRTSIGEGGAPWTSQPSSLLSLSLLLCCAVLCCSHFCFQFSCTQKQVTVDDAYVNGQKVMRRASQKLGKLLPGLPKDRRFCAFFGLLAQVSIPAWNMMEDKNVLPPNLKFLHFLWALAFMRTYPKNNTAILLLLGGIDPKRTSNYVWLFIRSLFC